MNEKKVHMLINDKPACGVKGEVETLIPIEFKGLVTGALSYACPECVGVYVRFTTFTLSEIDRLLDEDKGEK